MARKPATDPAPKLRTPDDVATAAIERFAQATAQGESVDAAAWKRAISAEVRAFAAEVIAGASAVAIATVAGGKKEGLKVAKEIADKLAGAAG